MNLLEHNLTLIISRSIEKRFLDFLVLHGYAVDRVVYLNNPSGYAAKQTDILKRKGFCVEVFGHGASQDRNLVEVPRVVINSLGFIGGSLGNDAIEYYKPNDQGKFDKLVGPSRSSNLKLDIELISNKSLQDAVLETTRSNALPNLSYIPIYNNPDETLLIEQGSPRNLPELGYGLIRRIYSYQVIDVFENLPITISTTIAKIREITVKESDNQGTIVKVP